MRIFNENKTIELKENEIDFTKGYLKNDKLFIKHHDKQDFQKEQFHYIIVAEYPNGGKEVKKVIDIPAQEAHDPYDEYEDILVFCLYNDEYYKNQLLEEKKSRLSELSKDIIQSEAGIIVTNITSKKLEFCNLLNEVRSLEGKQPKEINFEGVYNVK